MSTKIFLRIIIISVLLVTNPLKAQLQNLLENPSFEIYTSTFTEDDGNLVGNLQLNNRYWQSVIGYGQFNGAEHFHCDFENVIPLPPTPNSNINAVPYDGLYAYPNTNVFPANSNSCTVTGQHGFVGLHYISRDDDGSIIPGGYGPHGDYRELLSQKIENINDKKLDLSFYYRVGHVDLQHSTPATFSLEEISVIFTEDKLDHINNDPFYFTVENGGQTDLYYSTSSGTTEAETNIVEYKISKTFDNYNTWELAELEIDLPSSKSFNYFTIGNFQSSIELEKAGLVEAVSSGSYLNFYDRQEWYHFYDNFELYLDCTEFDLISNLNFIDDEIDIEDDKINFIRYIKLDLPSTLCCYKIVIGDNFEDTDCLAKIKFDDQIYNTNTSSTYEVCKSGTGNFSFSFTNFKDEVVLVYGDDPEELTFNCDFGEDIETDCTDCMSNTTVSFTNQNIFNQKCCYKLVPPSCTFNYYGMQVSKKNQSNEWQNHFYYYDSDNIMDNTVEEEEVSFCISYNDFGSNEDLDLRISFLDQDGKIICSKTETINNCNSGCLQIQGVLHEPQNKPCCRNLYFTNVDNSNDKFIYFSIFTTLQYLNLNSNPSNNHSSALSSGYTDLINSPANSVEFCNYSEDGIALVVVFYDIDENQTCTEPIYIPSCEGCECPTDLEEVLDVEFSTNPSNTIYGCDPDQCLLDLQLNDLFNSSSINCYEKFKLHTISNGVSLGNTNLIGTSKTLSQFDTEYVPVCIDPNQEVEVKLSLFKEGSSVPDCELSKTFSCSLDRSFLFDDNENGLPCATDCEELWIGEDGSTDVNAPASTATITIPDSDCYIEVDYKHRTACSGSYQDIFIQSYTIGNTSNSYNSCTLNWDRARVYEEALTRLMLENPMNFFPKDDEDVNAIEQGPKCATNWRVSKSSCWTQFTVGYYPTTIGPGGYQDTGGSTTFDDGGGIPIEYANIETRYESCDSDCCVRQFEVCKVYDQTSGTITTTISDLGLISSGSSCTTTVKADLVENFDGSNTITVDCTYDCNDLDSYNKSFKPITENSVKIPPRDPKLERIQMSDLIYGDQIEFRVKNSTVNGFSVTIASLNGLIIESQEFKINNLGENSYFIDISNYKTGTYVYTISVNGYYFKSNKFQIYK